MNSASDQPAGPKSRRFKLWIFLFIFASMVLVVILATRSHPAATASDVSISFLGYTNVSGIPRHYVQLSVSNLTSYTVRWRGQDIETEGDSVTHGVSINPKLAGYTYNHGKIIKTNLPVLAFSPTLKPGESLSLTIALPRPDPNGFPPAAARWRLSMFFCRYTTEERYYDFATRNHWPLKVGPIVLVDSQRFFDPSNNLTASSSWLSKE